jgi:hypothetical protein
MSVTTVDQVMANETWLEESVHTLDSAKQDAHERAARYRIPAFKQNDKLGMCWLVDGGPKNQTYRSEAAILRARAEMIVNMINTEVAIEEAAKNNG